MKRIIIVGGGISGLATAYLIEQQAKARQMPLEILLIEKEGRLGGKISSPVIDGYLCEAGPNGFLTNKPQTLDLCACLNLTARLLPSNDYARKRFIYSEQQLYRLPQNQLEFLRSQLISWQGKLRLALEILQPKRLATNDESVADFARRRLGKEALAKLIGPMCSGIFAGDPEQMSLAACFPRIYQLEQNYGSLLWAMWKLQRHHRQQVARGEMIASAAGPGGVLTSFANGSEELITSLAQALTLTEVQTNCSIEQLRPSINGGWQLVANQQALTADYVVIATPAYSAAILMKEFAPKLAINLGKITYSPLVVACTGYAQSQFPNSLDGFGYLVAHNQATPILGSLWDSSIFAKRAPAGHVLLRNMLGGARYPQVINYDDEQIFKLVHANLQQVLKVHGNPQFRQLYRYPQAIPHYQFGHTRLVAAIMQQASHFKHLSLTGNAYFGVGINDCIAHAYKCADHVITKLSSD